MREYKHKGQQNSQPITLSEDKFWLVDKTLSRIRSLMSRIKRRAAGWEASMLPLCYEAPPHGDNFIDYIMGRLRWKKEFPAKFVSIFWCPTGRLNVTFKTAWRKYGAVVKIRSPTEALGLKGDGPKRFDRVNVKTFFTHCQDLNLWPTSLAVLSHPSCLTEDFFSGIPASISTSFRRGFSRGRKI